MFGFEHQPIAHKSSLHRKPNCPDAMPQNAFATIQLQPRIIVIIILNLFCAVTEWRAPQGITKLSPDFMMKSAPSTVSSISPSTTCNSASNGAVCSESPCPASKLKSVTLPASLCISSLLTTLPSAYSTCAPAQNTFPFSNFAISVCFFVCLYINNAASAGLLQKRGIP